jgi:proline iminopeptidase
MQGIVEIDGFKLNYLIEGQGIPVLVIGGTKYYPKIFSDSLRKDLMMIFIDHRGFTVPPKDDLTKDAYELDILINDIEKVRAHLNLRNFVILGHSGHAFLALEYAKKFPQHVSKVALLTVTPDYSARTHQIAASFFEENAEPERKRLFVENMQNLPEKIAAEPEKTFIHFCLAAGPKSWYNYQFDATALWEGLYTNMTMIDHVWGPVFRDIDITKGLDNFKLPVFLALGKYDYLTGPTYLWDDIKTKFSDLSMHIFEKSAHCPPYEEPELFNKKFMQWIES